MTNPTVYLDTNIFSAYWYEGSEVAMRARRVHTREWWELERPDFSVWVSAFTETEVQNGRYRRQRDCLAMIRRLAFLPMTRTSRELFDALMELGVVPDTKRGDAVQMAVSAAHNMDYLLTWNYAHLANPSAQQRLEEICGRFELRAPLCVSPESIPQARFGQVIRRRNK